MWDLMNGKKTVAGLIVLAVGMLLPLVQKGLEAIGVAPDEATMAKFAEILTKLGEFGVAFGFAHKGAKIEKKVGGRVWLAVILLPLAAAASGCAWSVDKHGARADFLHSRYSMRFKDKQALELPDGIKAADSGSGEAPLVGDTEFETELSLAAIGKMDSDVAKMGYKGDGQGAFDINVGREVAGLDQTAQGPVIQSIVETTVKAAVSATLAYFGVPPAGLVQGAANGGVTAPESATAALGALAGKAAAAAAAKAAGGGGHEPVIDRDDRPHGTGDHRDPPGHGAPVHMQPHSHDGGKTWHVHKDPHRADDLGHGKGHGQTGDGRKKPGAGHGKPAAKPEPAHGHDAADNHGRGGEDHPPVPAIKEPGK